MRKQYRYLIGVSGGPDSMALLDMEYKKGTYVEVGHVNYHKRPTAKRDEDTVFNFCKERNIPFHLLNSNPDEVKGNFQAFARDQRYDFFKKICDERNLDGVLIAHQMDDLIETYLMQEEKKLGVSYYGLRKRNIINGVNVYRPLLNKTKKQLENYCISNNVPYGIDESNNTDDYSRNRVRHEKIEKMTLKEKKELVKKMNELNREHESNLKEASKYFNKEVFEMDEFINIPYVKQYIRTFFNHLSDDGLNEMFRQLKEAKQCIFESEKNILCKEYGKIEFFDRCDGYEYIFNNRNELLKFKYRYFRFGSKGESVNAVYLKNEDFPVTVRTCKENDSISMRFGTKKVNRFFIDKKIMYKDRLSWPLLFDSKGNLILLPGLGCDVEHYREKGNIYLIK